MKQIEAKPRQGIPLGHRGENEARQIIFDLTDYISTYGPGTARLLHQRDGDPAPYIVPAVQDGATLTWTVTDEDNAAPGTGRAELQWTVNNVLAKSDLWHTKTKAALDNGSPEPPTGAEGWYQQLIAYIDSLRDEGVTSEQIAAAVEAYLLEHPVDVPVTSVNGKIGAVQLTAEDVGALGQDELQTGVDAALAQAKVSGEFDGAPGDPGTDGITPTIGDNGNWYLGNTDTGKPSRGDTGPAGTDGRDGANGQPGENGADGYSPTANVTQNDNGATITITDKNGTTTATVTNGKDGSDGNPGADGSPGAPGADGKSAYQYAVEGGYTGTEAEFAALIASPGAYPVLDMTADTAELAPNTYYKWGEIAAMTITLGAEIAGITNEYCFEFISGATATELTVPSDIKWVQEPRIEAGKTYQVSILDGIGVICGA